MLHLLEPPPTDNIPETSFVVNGHLGFGKMNLSLDKFEVLKTKPRKANNVRPKKSCHSEQMLTQAQTESVDLKHQGDRSLKKFVQSNFEEI